MDPQEKYRIKQLLRKCRIASGKRYMKKKDRQAVIDGYRAMKSLGVFNSPAFACERKEPRRVYGNNKK